MTGVRRRLIGVTVVMTPRFTRGCNAGHPCVSGVKVQIVLQGCLKGYSFVIATSLRMYVDCTLCSVDTTEDQRKNRGLTRYSLVLLSRRSTKVSLSWKRWIRSMSSILSDGHALTKMVHNPCSSITPRCLPFRSVIETYSMKSLKTCGANARVLLP